MTNQIKIYTNVSTDISSPVFSPNIAQGVVTDIQIGFTGTFDGASYALETKTLDDTWIVTGDIFLKPECRLLSLVRGAEYRFTASSSGASTSVNAYVWTADLK